MTGGAALAVLLVLALPLLGLRTQVADERFLPAGNEARVTEAVMRVRFPALATSPIVVVADTDRRGAALDGFEHQLRSLHGVTAVLAQIDPLGRTRPAVLLVSTSGGEQGPVAVDGGAADPGLARGLRGADRWAGVAADRLVRSLGHRLPIVFGFVFGATLVLLWLFTGSVVLPIKAVLMNLLSIGATLGVTVWAFQQAHLAGVLGFTSTGTLELTVPVMIFLFAFGLSMDYEVFLLGRIKEEYDAHGDNDRAVAVGLQRVGRLVTSAAVLIVLVLGVAAATGTMLANQSFAFGLATAVIIDATIVRSVLVPSAMSLMGQLNWWSPPILRRLHERLGVTEVGAGTGPRSTWSWSRRRPAGRRTPSTSPRRKRMRRRRDVRAPREPRSTAAAGQSGAPSGRAGTAGVRLLRTGHRAGGQVSRQGPPGDVRTGEVTPRRAHRWDDLVGASAVARMPTSVIACLDWYDDNRRSSHARYLQLDVAALILAAAVPASAALNAPVAVPGVLGAFVTLVVGLRQLLRPHDDWIRNSRTLVRMQAEVVAWNEQVDPYHTGDQDRLLVARIEDIVASETADWRDLRSTVEEPEDTPST